MKPILAMVIVVATSCTTGGKQASFEQSEVLERMGNQSKTPQWAYGEQSMSYENNEVQFVQFINTDGATRPESCLKIAEVDARVAILKNIKTGLSETGQVNETDVISDPHYESLQAWMASGKLIGVKTQQRYFEKRVESDTSGERRLRLFCAVKVGIKRADLDRQIKSALGNRGNKEVREKLLKAQGEFIESLGRENKAESK